MLSVGMMGGCCVVGCSYRLGSRECQLHSLPSNNKGPTRRQRQAWLKWLEETNGKAVSPEKLVFICGAHFIGGKISIPRLYNTVLLFQFFAK